MQQSWHLIAKQLEWEVDLVNPLLDGETVNLSRQLAELYQQLLNPFEMVWEKALLKQQQQIREKQSEAQAFQNRNASGNSNSNGRRGSINGLGVGWPQNQGGLNGNIQGVGGVGGMAGPSVALQQAGMGGMGMESIPLPPNPFNSQQGGQSITRPLSSHSLGAGGGAGDGNGNLGSSLRPGTVVPTMEQMAEARMVVEELRRNVDATRRKFYFTSFEIESELMKC